MRHTIIMLLCMCAVAGYATVFAQSVEQKEAIGKLGKGFVVYGHNNTIKRIVLDGAGEVTPEVLYDSAGLLYKDAPCPMVSFDGSYIFFRKCDEQRYCDFYRMDADGGNVIKISQQPYRYAHYARCATGGNYRIVFISNESLQGGAWEEETDGWWTHPKIYVMDEQGIATRVRDFATVNADYLDISHSIITFRKERSDLYVYDFANDVQKKIRQGCGQTLSPDAARLLVNNIKHDGYYLYEGSEKEWRLVKSGYFGERRHFFKWSNHPHWVSLQSDDTTRPALWAFNVETEEQIRLTFDGGNTNGGLFLEEGASAHPEYDMRSLGVAIYKADDGRYMRVCDVRGRYVHAGNIAGSIAGASGKKRLPPGVYYIVASRSNRAIRSGILVERNIFFQ